MSEDVSMDVFSYAKFDHVYFSHGWTVQMKEKIYLETPTQVFAIEVHKSNKRQQNSVCGELNYNMEPSWLSSTNGKRMLHD